MGSDGGIRILREEVSNSSSDIVSPRRTLSKQASKLQIVKSFMYLKKVCLVRKFLNNKELLFTDN